jgi:ABC-2 type transport system ATP-binding protein
MLAVVGLLRIRSGSLEVAGSDLATASGRRAAARSVGYLPQDPSFPPGFSVEAFLEYCCYLAAVPRCATASAVDAAVAAADLAPERRRPLHRLSGGQRRRALVAGAAVGEPSVLVLDEPGVGIDAPHREALRRQLRSLAANAAVVVSSHIAEDFESLADAVVFFRAGGVAYAGDREGFLARGGAGTPDAPSSAAERALLALAGPEGHR